MALLGTLKARVADELQRPELGPQIALAIASAVAFYETGQRFWFNETMGTFSTTIGREYYTATDFAALPNVQIIDSLRVQLSNRWFVMVRRTWDDLQLMSAGLTMNADPTDFAYYEGALRLYPVPTAVRTVEISYVQSFGVPASDAATNVWTTQAEELIRLHAKADLLENVIREEGNESLKMRAREAEVLRQLQRQTRTLASSGSVQAYYL